MFDKYALLALGSLSINHIQRSDKRSWRKNEIYILTDNQQDYIIDGLQSELSYNSTVFTWCMTAENIFWVIFAAAIVFHGPRCSHHYQSDLLREIFTQMSAHTACYNKNNLNKWSHRPPEHVLLHLNMKMTLLPCPPPSSIQTYHPVSVSCLSRLWGHGRTGEDKLQPQSPGYLLCFHLHQQLISHHWRALACQAEDFIRDVLYGS